MRLYALSIYAAVGLTISTAAMPTGSPPCHDESVMPDKTLPYLSLPPQTSYTEKPYLPYAASLSPPPAPKVESPKPEQKSYPPAQAPKPYLEKLTPEKPYATPPLRKEENPYAAPPFPLLSKEEVSKSKEKSCTLGLVPEPYPEKPKSVSKEGRYRRQEKSYSPPPPPPPPHSQPYSEMTKSEAKPKPWAKTKPEVKPKPEVKSYQRKQPYFEEKGKSDKKQKPQDHYTKASDKSTAERLDSLDLSSQANSLVGSDSIEIPTEGHCLVNGYSTNGSECPKELPYARRSVSTVSWRSIADR